MINEYPQLFEGLGNIKGKPVHIQLEENVNADKCSFKQSSAIFLGHKITTAGIEPLSMKLEAIKQFQRPTNITELRRFLGMAQQLSKFCPDLAKVSEPLRNLLSAKHVWVWIENHKQAFVAIKMVLSTPPILGTLRNEDG